jgi:hypothetical protein
MWTRVPGCSWLAGTDRGRCASAGAGGLLALVGEELEPAQVVDVLGVPGWPWLALVGEVLALVPCAGDGPG